MSDNVDFNLFAGKISEMERVLATQKTFQGGGGSGGSTEARLAKLEASVEHMAREMSDLKVESRTLRENARTDFRILFGAVIAATLGLAALMGKGFHWI